MNPLLKKIAELKKTINEKEYKENNMEDELSIRQLKYDLKMTQIRYKKSKLR